VMTKGCPLDSSDFRTVDKLESLLCANERLSFGRR
jgi:hypothetical protein